MFACLLTLLLLWPAAAGATAGFAERHSEMRYDAFASVVWTHPGDGCDCGESCFRIVRRESRHRAFPGLEGTLVQLNVPGRGDAPWLIGQACGGRWLVYDLAAGERLADTPDEAGALAFWRSSGRATPRFADARSGARGLGQEWRSLGEDWFLLAILYAPLVVLAAIAAALVAAVVVLSDRRRAKPEPAA